MQAGRASGPETSSPPVGPGDGWAGSDCAGAQACIPPDAAY